MPEKIRALACLVFEISTVIHLFITHCVVSRDWIRGRDRMQLGAANRVTCSANEELYPVKWDRMLVKGSRVCTISRHERDLFRSISRKPDMLELPFFQVSCISMGQINVITCSANEVLYPVKWDRMLVKGSRVCTISRHERNLFRSISRKPDMLELPFFQVSCISMGQIKVAQRECDPGTARGRKPRKINVYSKK